VNSFVEYALTLFIVYCQQWQ